MIVFRYCFAGAAFPRDSGEGGAKDWYLSVCRYRRDVWIVREVVFEVGYFGRNDCEAKKRLEDREKAAEVGVRERDIRGLHLAPMLREHSSPECSNMAVQRVVVEAEGRSLRT